MLSNPKNLTAGAAPQIGPNGPATLTINDDDVSTFKLQRARVLRPRRTTRPVTPRSPSTAPARPTSPRPSTTSTSDGTATAGSDYTAAAGTLNFAAGETSKTFDVDVTNDGTAEANETVNLTLTSGATTVDTSLLSIVDNDNPKASVQFSRPALRRQRGRRHRRRSP